MARGKSFEDLQREWRATPKDWFSVYQWPSLATSAHTEQVAALILNGRQQMHLKTEDLRQSNFRLAAHKGQCSLQTPICQFTEKRFVRAMYNLGETVLLGQMLDYEVPLKASLSAQHGDIDLLCLNEPSLLIIEAKQHHSKESILKGLLQAYTYARLVQHVKDSFMHSFGLCSSLELVPAVLTFGTAQAGRQLKSFADWPNTRELLCRLNSDLTALGLGAIRAYINNDSEATLGGCLTASPCGQHGCIVRFRAGFIPQFQCVEL